MENLIMNGLLLLNPQQNTFKYLTKIKAILLLQSYVNQNRIIKRNKNYYYTETLYLGCYNFNFDL